MRRNNAIHQPEIILRNYIFDASSMVSELINKEIGYDSKQSKISKGESEFQDLVARTGKRFLYLIGRRLFVSGTA